MTKRNDRLLTLLALLLAGGLRLHRAGLLGAQADEGVHLVVASRVAAGAAVYRDLFENRTPLAEWLLALLFELTGVDLFAARVLSVAAAVLTVAAIVAVVRLAGGDRWGSLLGGLLFAAAPLAVFWGRFALLEPFAVALSALSLAAGLRAWRGPGGRWWVASGVLAALALLAKQTAVIYAGVFLLFLLLAVRRGLLRWLAGFAAPLVAFAALLLAQGAWGPFWAFASGADRLGAGLPWADAARMWLDWAARQPLAPLASVAALVALFSRRPALLLTGGWAAAEWLALLLAPGLRLGFGGLSHYLLPLLASAAVFVGAGVSAAEQDRRNRTIVLAGGLLALLTLPAWSADLRHVTWETAYPQPDRIAEQEIGRAAALLTPEDERLVVLGNAVFYLTAERQAASRFFHVPDYLGSSDLAPQAERALLDALGDVRTGAVLLSGLHLAERLPPAVADSLWRQWTPAARFSYPYQRDVFLFRPRDASAPQGELARFGDGIVLRALDASLLNGNTLLVSAVWQAETAQAGDLVVFTHVLDASGNLLAQHDGVPAVGFRPAAGWQPGELIADDHWIVLPEGGLPAGGTLSVGLYRPQDVTRLDRGDGSGENSYLMPLDLP